MSEEDNDNELANEPIHDVLRKILNDADKPLTMDEIENRLHERLQAGIRGLIFTGEWEKHDKTVERHERRYSINKEVNE